MTFPKRYYRDGNRISAAVHRLWLYDKLTKRNVRTALQSLLGDVAIQTGAFRSTAILPQAVIKVPHAEEGIKSTLLEVELLQKMRRSRYRRHFPETQIITTSNVPVLVQSRVADVAAYSSADVEADVTTFAKALGIGDVHAHNYGWGYDRRGMYPVFIDCETSTRGKNLTTRDVQKFETSSAAWHYPFTHE
jgi:hypothetical protein